MDTPSTPNLEQLLIHAQWARALARQLVTDEQRADDVVQQAWLAAVERPPEPGPGLRAWFARLIKNVASNRRAPSDVAFGTNRPRPRPSPRPPRRRSSTNSPRSSWSHRRCSSSTSPTARRCCALGAGDERPAAIARAMEVPVKTVDTRLARGLERLRAKLTELKGGDARSWALLLMPLAKQAPGAAAAATSGGVVGSLAAGVVAMSMTAKLVAAGVVVAAAVGSWAAVGSRGARSAMPPWDGVPAQEVAAERASDAKNGAANEGVVAAPIAASRAPEPSAAATPVAKKRDPLEPWRGAWHLQGRVVAKGTHVPVAGVEVEAQIEEFMFGTPLANVRTDLNGEFALERLSKAVRLHFHADRQLPFDAKLADAELLADAAAPPREFEMEPLTFGALVCTLRSRDGRQIPPALLAAATVLYGPAEIGGYEHERFDRLPLPIPNGPGVEGVIPSERVGDLFRIDHAPACTPITLLARAGHSDLGRLRIEPLAPGETREVVVPIACGILVATSCVDAATHEPISLEWANANPPIVLHWSGANASDHLERDLAERELDGTLALPGPGHVTLVGALDGFAPLATSVDVDDGAKLAIPLTRWRPLLVKVVTADGEPLKHRGFGSQGETATTKCKGMAFMLAGRAPDCVVVPAAAKLPAELDDDTVRVSRWRARIGSGRGYFTIAGFEGFAPPEPLRVDVYDDARLVGSADIPATAPLLQPDPTAPKGEGSRGEIIPDEPVKPWADRFGPTQTVTVTVALPPPADGSLRFEAVDAADGKPIPYYEVAVTPVVNQELESPTGSSEFKVADAQHGLFHCTAIPAGAWRMRIRRGPIGVFVWSETITIEKDRLNDLGTLTLPAQGTLAVRVVDDAGVPLADAEVRVTSRDDGAPVELSVHGRYRLASARTDAEGHDLQIKLPARAVQIDARSDGYAPASADVDVPAAGSASCTVTLHALPAKPDSSNAKDH